MEVDWDVEPLIITEHEEVSKAEPHVKEDKRVKYKRKPRRKASNQKGDEYFPLRPLSIELVKDR